MQVIFIRSDIAVSAFDDRKFDVSVPAFDDRKSDISVPAFDDKKFDISMPVYRFSVAEMFAANSSTFHF